MTATDQVAGENASSDMYSDDSLPLETLIHYAQSNAAVSSTITNLCAFIVGTCALTAIIQSSLLILGFLMRNRQSLSADYAYAIIHASTIALALVGLSYLGPLFKDSLGAVRMTKIHLDTSIRTEEITTTFNCFLPFVFQVSHMLMFYVISLTALANYLNIAFPRYSMSTKSMVAVCLAITVFCTLVNMHFLLAHCVSGSTEDLFSVDDHSVVVKYVVVDGMAFLLTMLLCGHSFCLISSNHNAPDASIWKRECVASITVALLFGINTAIIFGINASTDNSVALTLHATHITMAITQITLAMIPLSLCTIRPATRSDFENFFERIRFKLYSGDDDLPGCCGRCLSHANPQQVDMEPYWVYAETNDTAQLVETNSLSTESPSRSVPK